MMLLGASRVKAACVCTEDELINEIREDIADNGNCLRLGKLDCLRHT